MKKIYYWSPHISRVATIKNVFNSAVSLARYTSEKLDVSIIDVFGEWKDLKEEMRSKNVNYIKLSKLDLSNFLPISGYFKGRLFYIFIFFFKILSLGKILKEKKPDYFIIHLITIMPLFLLLKNNYKTKFILRISGLPKFNFLRKLLWKMVSKKISLVTCPSLQTKNDIENFNIFPKEKLVVLYDPILDVKSLNKKKFLNENNKVFNNKYFLNIGRLTKQKNQSLLINAFSNLKNKNINLYIAGEGENKKKLLKLIKLKKLEKRVFLIGQIENIFPYINNSLAVISTSLWEDPGAVMIEAAFCRKNVISSNCPNGPSEFLQNGKSGYLFKNNNQEDLELKLNDFLNDSQEIKQNQIKLCLKQIKDYTLFRHFIQLKNLLI